MYNKKVSQWKMNIKNIIQAYFSILISLLVMTDSYADSYRVQGEFYFDNGTNNKAVRGFASNVVSGIPINLMMGNKVISMVFTIEPPPSNNYSMTIQTVKVFGDKRKKCRNFTE